MSTVDPDEIIEIEDEGVSVEKRFAPEEFPVPAVRFEFQSDHDDPVAVRLSEDIPESFPMDGVGFHPDYHSDQWTAFQDNHVEFVGTVSPDEPLVTVYGVRIEDPEEAGQFLTEPELLEVDTDVDAVEDSDGDVDESSIDDLAGDDDAVKDMLSGESDSVPGLDDDEDDEGEEDLDLDLGDVEEDADEDLDLDIDEDAEDDEDLDLDLDDEAEDDDESTDDEDLDIELDEDESEEDDEDVELEEDEEDIELEEDEPAETDSADDSGTERRRPVRTTPTEPVGERLAQEIKAGKLAEEDLDVLRDELEIEAPGVDLAKVEHLQSRVEEVAAYTDALEEFLEEEGTGTQLIEEFREELERFETRLAETEEDLEGVASSVEEVDATAADRAADLEADIDAVEEDIGAVADDVEDLEEDLEDVEEDVEDVTDRLEDIGEDVSDILEWRSELGSMFQN